MISSQSQREVMRHLASMPFLDRLELVSISGWSRGAVYGSVAKLERLGLAGSVRHSTPLIAPTRRFYLTTAGLELLARVENVATGDLLRTYPVSAHWLRILLERLDAAAVIYRLASGVANAVGPIRFRWYRSGPLDAAISVSGGRTIGVVRLGHTADWTPFAKRLHRLWETPQASVLLFIVPDPVRLRRVRRTLTSAPTIGFVACEEEVAQGGPDSRIWRPPSANAVLGLSKALSFIKRPGLLPGETSPKRLVLPVESFAAGAVAINSTVLMPTLLGPAEKRALDVLSDWPWITQAHLAPLLGIKKTRLSQLLENLEALDLLLHITIGRKRRLALTDLGLALLARRDRTSVGSAIKRWSAKSEGSGGSDLWRGRRGSMSKQLLRHLAHTESVHGFVAHLARQAPTQGWQLKQIDPPRRASRYFQYDERLHSIRPDAFGVLKSFTEEWPFFLEWERRAVRPVTMAARLAPYLRYFSTRQPVEDHGGQPGVLVVFEDEIAEVHFLRIARQEMSRVGVEAPLWVSCQGRLEKEGPLGMVWRTPESWSPVRPFSNG